MPELDSSHSTTSKRRNRGAIGETWRLLPPAARRAAAATARRRARPGNPRLAPLWALPLFSQLSVIFPRCLAATFTPTPERPSARVCPLPSSSPSPLCLKFAGIRSSRPVLIRARCCRRRVPRSSFVLNGPGAVAAAPGRLSDTAASARRAAERCQPLPPPPAAVAARGSWRWLAAPAACHHGQEACTEGSCIPDGHRVARGAWRVSKHGGRQAGGRAGEPPELPAARGPGLDEAPAPLLLCLAMPVQQRCCIDGCCGPSPQPTCQLVWAPHPPTHPTQVQGQPQRALLQAPALHPLRHLLPAL